MKSSDVLIVGGGIIGFAIARSLAAEGLDVTVVERALPGQEASAAAAGMLAPQGEVEEQGPFLDLCLESRRLYPALAEELFGEIGAEIRYRTEGTFCVAFTDQEAERLRATAELHRSLG